MPIYKPGQLPQTGISWVDALLRAMHEDPTSAGPTAMGVPMKILTRPGPARRLVGELARRMPKLHKAAQKAPDVTLAYPADIAPAAAQYQWLTRPKNFPTVPQTIKPVPNIRVAGGGGERGDPLGGLVHELLHHFYKTKNLGKLTHSIEKAAFPIRSEKIGRAYRHLTPDWIEQSLMAKYSPKRPDYWGEQAIEGMEALIMRKAKP